MSCALHRSWNGGSRLSDESSFFELMKRRIIVVSTMDRELRITFACGSALVALLTVLSLFEMPFGSPVSSPVGEMPIGILVIVLVTQLFVLTLFFIGVLRCRAPLRHWILVFLGVLSLIHLWLNDFTVLSFVGLIPLAVLAVQGELGERTTVAPIASIYGGFAVASLTLLIGLVWILADDQALVVSALALQATLAMFGLFMAGTDVAEMIAIAAQVSVKAVSSVSRFTVWALLVAIASALLTIAAAVSVDADAANLFASRLGAGAGLALWLGLVFWLLVGRARKLGTIAPSITYRALLFIVFAYFVVFQGGMFYRLLSDPNNYDPSSLFTYPELFIVPTLAALVSLVLIFLIGGRSRHIFVNLAYCFLIGFFWFFFFNSQGANIILFVYAAAVGSLLFLMVAAIPSSSRANFRTIAIRLAELNVSFALYALILTWFLTGMQAPGGLTVLQVLIVFAALAWDLVSSGDAITNKHTEELPRMARVSFFFAYVLTTALFVVVSRNGHLVSPLTLERVDPFQSDGLVGVGLVLFGLPFLFMVFGLRMRGILKRESGAAADEQPVVSAPAAI
jgi:hypothetical protein